MRFLIAGSSGFLGTQLREHLTSRGHDVVGLVRGEPSAPNQVRWDPAAGSVPADHVEQADVVVNLAGAPLVGNPYSSAYRERLRSSRVDTTTTLARAVAVSERRPVLLAQNGIGYYGDHGTSVVDERTQARPGSLLGSISVDWQEATEPAQAAGARVCVLRTAPVMHRTAPPLNMLRLVFKAGLGGPLGSGRQFMPMVSLRDWLSAATHLAEHDDAAGPFNLTVPDPPTNRDFTRELGRQVHRPAVLPVPSPVIRLATKDLAPELLGSVRAVPRALLETGFTFADRDVAAVLRSGLA